MGTDAARHPGLGAASVIAGSSEQGLAGAHFRGRGLEGEPVFTRVDPKVDFRWDRGSPTDEAIARGEHPADKGLPADGFSVRWTGVLTPQVSGEFEFVLTANDGARLTVDGTKVVDAWVDGPVDVSVNVKNTGTRAGDEVVQLYLRDPAGGPAAAIRSLRGIRRVTLAPGETKTVSFTVEPARDLLFHDEAKKAQAVKTGAWEIEIGGLVLDDVSAVKNDPDREARKALPAL